MPFELPEDNDIQKAQAIAEGIAHIVATYHHTLVGQLVPSDLASELTIQYAEQTYRLIYGLDRPIPPTPQAPPRS